MSQQSIQYVRNQLEQRTNRIQSTSIVTTTTKAPPTTTTTTAKRTVNDSASTTNPNVSSIRRHYENGKQIAASNHESVNDNDVVSLTTKTMFLAIVLIPVLFAAIYGFLQKDHGDFTKEFLYDQYSETLETIRQNPLIADDIIINWWRLWKECGMNTMYHTYYALSNVLIFFYLTMKPLVYMIYYVVIRFFMYHFLYKILLQQMLLSPKAVIQIKLLIHTAIQYQQSLSWQQVMIEICILSSSYIIYRSYHYLKRQTYVQKIKRFYQKQKNKVVKKYREVIERAYQFSALIAMLIPHALFVGVTCVVKFFFPSVVSWIACETALINVLQWYYPVIATIAVIQAFYDFVANDNQSSQHEENKRTQMNGVSQHIDSNSNRSSTWDATKSNLFPRTRPTVGSQSIEASKKVSLSSSKNPISSGIGNNKKHATPSSRLLAPTKQSAARSRETQEKKRHLTRSSATSKTASAIKVADVSNSRNLCSSSALSTTSLTATFFSPIRRRTALPHSSDDNEIDTSGSLYDTMTEKDMINYRVTYWLQYWIIIATIASMKRMFNLLPWLSRVALRWVIQNRTVASGVQQMELIFWIWLNIMPNIGSSVVLTTVSHSDNHAKSNHDQPISIMEHLLTKVIQPLHQRLYESLSSMITEETWDMYCVQKYVKMIETFIYLKLVSQEFADMTTHLIKECRCLLVPFIVTLSWPISSYGVMYAQYGLPLAKSMSPSSSDQHRTDVNWLQFWILNSILSGLLHHLASVLWYIPLSNIFIYCFYASLAVVHGSTISSLYKILIQKELQALGIINSNDPNHANDDDENSADSIATSSNILRVVNWVISRLPRADIHDDNNDENNQENENNSRDEADEDVAVCDSNETFDENDENNSNNGDGWNNSRYIDDDNRHDKMQQTTTTKYTDPLEVISSSEKPLVTNDTLSWDVQDETHDEETDKKISEWNGSSLMELTLDGDGASDDTKTSQEVSFRRSRRLQEKKANA